MLINITYDFTIRKTQQVYLLKYNEMKDELIDILNKKAEQNLRLMSFSAFSLVGINFLLTILITNVKYSEIIHLTDAPLIKKFFWNFS